MLEARMFLFIGVTISCAVLSQIIVKKVMLNMVEVPGTIYGQYLAVIPQLLNPKVWPAIALNLIGGLSWMLVARKVPMSVAFPFTALTYILVFISGRLFFNEPFTAQKIIASGFIIMGLMVLALPKSYFNL